MQFKIPLLLVMQNKCSTEEFCTVKNGKELKVYPAYFTVINNRKRSA